MDLTQERCNWVGEMLRSANINLHCCKESLWPSGLTVAVGDSRGLAEALGMNHQGLSVPRDDFALCHVCGSIRVQRCGMGDGDAQLVAEDMAMLCLQGKAWIVLENKGRR